MCVWWRVNEEILNKKKWLIELTLTNTVIWSSPFVEENVHRRTTTNVLNNTSQTFHWPLFRFRWSEVFLIGEIHWKHFIKSQETLTSVLVDESTSLQKHLFTLTNLLLFSVLTLCFSWKRARKMDNKALEVFYDEQKVRCKWLRQTQAAFWNSSSSP